MAFKRISTPPSFAKGEELTRDLVGIGINLSGEGHPANIEDTLVAASLEGLEHDDLRVLSLLVDWLDVHFERINADRLARLTRSISSERTQTFWSAVASWKGSRDSRFAKLRKQTGPRVELLRAGNAFQVTRRGEDKRFAGTRLIVPAGVLRHRNSDILPPSALAKLHPTYKERIRSGPSYRADAWAELQKEPTLSATELARRVYCSFAAAWAAQRDFAFLNESTLPVLR